MDSETDKDELEGASPEGASPEGASPEGASPEGVIPRVAERLYEVYRNRRGPIRDIVLVRSEPGKVVVGFALHGG
jgi:hypothetical protein